jgi:hypothetical protein
MGAAGKNQLVEADSDWQVQNVRKILKNGINFRIVTTTPIFYDSELFQNLNTETSLK